MERLPIRQIFLIALGLAYVGMGAFIYLSEVIPTPPWGTVLATLFIGYGAWRTYRGFALR